MQRARDNLTHFHVDIDRERTDGNEQPRGEINRTARNHLHRHRFAHRSADAEDERGDDARACRREHDAEYRLRLGIAHGERAFEVLRRDGFQCILGQRCDRRNDHDRKHDARCKHAVAAIVRVHVDQPALHKDDDAEITVNNGRNAGKQFDDLVEDGAQIDLVEPCHRLLQKLAVPAVPDMELIRAPEHHKDCREYTDDPAENDGEQGDDKRTAQHCQNAVRARVEIPIRTKQEPEEPNIPERGNGGGKNVGDDAKDSKNGQTSTDDKEYFCRSILYFCR